MVKQATCYATGSGKKLLDVYGQLWHDPRWQLLLSMKDTKRALRQEIIKVMDHKDHVYLLRKGIPLRGGVWADFGSGAGAFTLALADLIGPTGEIYSVDKERNALREQEKAMRSRFPGTTVHYLNADFTQRLAIPPLDGVVMANSLHFLRNKDPMLQLVRSYLRPDGRLLIVEYNTDRGNTWVPYPFSFHTWEEMARQNGFSGTQLVATVSSRFFDGMYAAVSLQAALPSA